MSYLNVEIKAKCNAPEKVRNYLLANNAVYKGVDLQTDTYFKVPNGRLKLRQGNIENNLIYYERTNQAGPKQSHFQLVKVEDAEGLKAALAKANGIKVVVEKRREIYFIANVKFHIDEVPGLGSFVEIEAGNLTINLSKDDLQHQCEQYMAAFEIEESDLLETSYSDMLMEKNKET
jgi:adenylate cyclase, class 2